MCSGWDIRPTKVGDALYDSRVLPDDLVRQVRPALNRLTVMKGIYASSYIGDTQHASATHVKKAAASKRGVASREAALAKRRQLLEQVRGDIRRFKRQNGLNAGAFGSAHE